MYENAFNKLLLNMTLSTASMGLLYGLYEIQWRLDILPYTGDNDVMFEVSLMILSVVYPIFTSPVYLATLLYTIFGKMRGMVSG